MGKRLSSSLICDDSLTAISPSESWIFLATKLLVASVFIRRVLTWFTLPSLWWLGGCVAWPGYSHTNRGFTENQHTETTFHLFPTHVHNETFQLLRLGLFLLGILQE